MSFPRYGSYKDSGVEWLGEVPAHWGVLRLKDIVTWNDEVLGEETLPDREIEYIEISDVSLSEGVTASTTMLFEAAPSRARRIVRNEDILISTVRTYLRSIAIIRNASPNLVASTGFAVLRSRHAVPRFIGYAVQAEEFVGQVIARSVGVSYPAINASDLVKITIAIPAGWAEQAAIADFLDRETTKIDALIEAQRRLIELLKEKRQAVISHAVTKGLDPNVPMKPSGVEWLGYVPAHWVVLQLGKLCQKVSDGPHFSPEYIDDGVMFISARNIKVGYWSLDDVKYISESDYREYCKRVVPEIGDVLYTKGGTTGIARVVDIQEPFQVWVHVAVLKLKQEIIDSYFVENSLNSKGCYDQSQLHTRGATNQDLGLTRLTRIWLALPPIEEQRKINLKLNSTTRKIDELINNAESAITLLQERRAALISAAVTGKIDVRGLVSVPAEPATAEAA